MGLNKLFALSLALLCGSLSGRTQTPVISVGSSSAMLIRSGTIFSADSLVLTPGADLSLVSNSIGITKTAVGFAPNPGISRVYYLGSPIIFTGTIQLYYQPSELNGNIEGSLLLTDSALGGTWTSEVASSVNTVAHYVQLTGSGHSFIAATASGMIVSLPLSLISFSGAWQGNGVELEWVVEQSDEVANFAVESSMDGYSWKKIGARPGQGSNGLYTYDFLDAAPPSNIMYYRIDILHSSGEVTYSNVVKVQKAEDNRVRLLARGNAVSVYFPGQPPAGIRVIDVLGKILQEDPTSRQRYDLNGLFPGAYFLQYESGGQWITRQFIIR